MAVAPIPVDQRLIGIDSRRFASIEKALVELITNSDDSYSRLEKRGAQVTGRIDIRYERHQSGAILQVTDQAEGMSFDQASRILTYGGAHSPLSRGEGDGRGYFGRGLKQAVFGLGSGLLETIKDGRLTRIELFREENGGYLYDDSGADQPASDADHERLGIVESGTRVTIVVENPHVIVSHFQTAVQAIADNVYLRDVMARRTVEIVHVARGHEIERSGRVRFEEPPAIVLIGPDAAESFVFEGVEYPFTITLKHTKGVELRMTGDERTNGLVVVSGLAVLDCQLFEYENQVGAEYLFGIVRCPGLIERLGQGEPIISDEREGLNHKDNFVVALSRAVSRLLSEHVLAERERLKHLDRASTSDRTAHMIDRLLHRMSESAVRDLGIGSAPKPRPALTTPPASPPALRFTTPFYYRRPGHPFHVALLVDSAQLSDGAPLTIDCTLPDSVSITPDPEGIPVERLSGVERLEWTIESDSPGDRGDILVRSGAFWAWCEIVIAEHESSAPRHRNESRHRDGLHRSHANGKTSPRDHGEDMFAGYELRYLEHELDRAVYSAAERKIIINTGDPTVQLYLDGRGRFRDAARLLLAELFLEVIADELARRSVERSGRQGDLDAFRETRQDIIRRYGADVHKSFI
ncbi:MAG: ATP-binding protein [Rhodococcus sp. (in: high G+C Gram-positive bacteria)]|uniref:ATP-binding protein n=1 Tax=Rhodococcus sp. TaxID=1831 RepID=UPI003BB0354E